MTLPDAGVLLVLDCAFVATVEGFRALRSLRVALDALAVALDAYTDWRRER